MRTPAEHVDAARRPVVARPVRDEPRAGAEPRGVRGVHRRGSIAPIVMIRRGDLKYVHSPVDPDQLYDLAADPDERVNLARTPTGRRTVERAAPRGRPATGTSTRSTTTWSPTRRGAGSSTPRCAPAGQRRWEYTPPHDGSASTCATTSTSTRSSAPPGGHAVHRVVSTLGRMMQSEMTSRLVALCFDANDPLRLARFWAEALRWEIDDETA